MAHQSHPPHLLLHKLIGALSYYGTSVRTILFGFVLAIAVVLGVTSGGLSAGASFENYVYIVGSFLLLDAGYVTIARALPISTESIDQVLFLAMLVILALLIIFPYFATAPAGLLITAKESFLFALFALTLRMVLGFFVGHRAR